MDKLTINLGNVKDFCEEMKSQKRWLVEQRAMLKKGGMSDDSPEVSNLSGMIHLYDEIGDQIAEQYGLPMTTVFEISETD